MPIPGSPETNTSLPAPRCNGLPVLAQPGPCFWALDEPNQRTGFETVPGPASLEHSKGGDRISDPFQHQGAERLQLEETGDQLGGVATDDHLTRVARGLQPSCHVRNLTPDVGQTLRPARRHGRDEHFAGVDAGTTAQFANAQGR